VKTPRGKPVASINHLSVSVQSRERSKQSTTLNAKMKHYGLNPVRSITLKQA